MHATRARLPHKGPRKAGASKKAGVKNAGSQAASCALTQVLPEGVASLAAHRVIAEQRTTPATEVFVLVEWIAPARESWCRGELEVRRSACMPMSAKRGADGILLLSDLPGQGDALVLEKAALSQLRRGATLVRTLPGLRVTLTAEDIGPALPPAPQAAVILGFPTRA
jgi:hypothetical protein